MAASGRRWLSLGASLLVMLLSCALSPGAPSPSPSAPEPETASERHPAAVRHPQPAGAETFRIVTTEPFLSLRLQGETAELTGLDREQWSAEALRWWTEGDTYFFEAVGLDGARIEGRVLEESCNDGMSDVLFAWSAQLTLHTGEALHGCGAPSDRWPIADFHFQVPSPEEAEQCVWHRIDDLWAARVNPDDDHVEPTAALRETARHRNGAILVRDEPQDSDESAYSLLLPCDQGHRRIYGPHQALEMRPIASEDGTLTVDLHERFSRGACITPVRTRIQYRSGLWVALGITCATRLPDNADECPHLPPLCLPEPP